MNVFNFFLSVACEKEFKLDVVAPFCQCNQLTSCQVSLYRWDSSPRFCNNPHWYPRGDLFSFCCLLPEYQVSQGWRVHPRIKAFHGGLFRPTSDHIPGDVGEDPGDDPRGNQRRFGTHSRQVLHGGKVQRSVDSSFFSCGQSDSEDSATEYLILHVLL